MYHEFTDQITKLEQLSKSHVPTAASAPKPKQRRKLKRATVSPSSGGRGEKLRSEQSLPPATSTFSEGENSLMEETDFSNDCSEKQVRQKDATSAAIPGLPGSAEIGDAPSKLDEGGENFFKSVYNEEIKRRERYLNSKSANCGNPQMPGL
ncbi:hypothetical protein TNCT_213591 [Trichonephila clavata]|uniref:Uncharacterized protein n=1 Tax=Trichonephila clavata TaxID=2740835 RepID=A0A8X6LRP3_TRICU|nr:hypothetical protein TNCT_213591 [Trichonephila clavata]